MWEDQDTLMVVVCFCGTYIVCYWESDCMRIVLQVALTAGEHLLTSVSTFDQTHCIAQDLTISKSMSQWGMEIYFTNEWFKEENLWKGKKQGGIFNFCFERYERMAFRYSWHKFVIIFFWGGLPLVGLPLEPGLFICVLSVCIKVSNLISKYHVFSWWNGTKVLWRQFLMCVL